MIAGGPAEDVHWLSFFARFGAEVLAAHKRQEPTGLARAFQRSLPLAVVDVLAWGWGRRSRGVTIRKCPPGALFIHCAECRIPTSPSGTAVLTPMPLAVTAEQAAALCAAERARV
jgi:hypothetical protein